MKRRVSIAVVGLMTMCHCDRPTASQAFAPPATSATSERARVPALLPTAAASPSSASASAPMVEAQAEVATFDGDPLGAPSPAFEAVVGDWYVADEADARALKVDGAKWRNGEPSANIADQAKRLYGDRYAEFLDGVKAFAFYPLAIWKRDPPAGDMRVAMRFYPLAGRIDQGAGIAFAVSPDGSYFGARANALEDNILFFRVVKGKRTIIDTIRNVSTPSKVWHTFAIELRGKVLTIELDGKKRFEKTLDAPPIGRLALWSKADSQVLFDDFAVASLSSKVAP